GARCESEAGGICGIVVCLWRHSDSAEARGNDSESDLAVCGGEARKRVLHDFVLPLLRPRDGLLALLQYFWAATGPYVAILRRAGEVHHADAQGRAADDSW